MRSGALVAFAVVGIAVCAWIATPFVSALTWAFALAVVAAPLHDRIERRLRRPGLAAGTSVLLVTLLLLIPTMITAWQVGVQVSEGLEQMQQQLEAGALKDIAARVPGGTRIYEMVMSDKGSATSLVPTVQQQAGAWLATTISVVFQVLVAAFALFFLLRDRSAVLATIRSYLPMTGPEATLFLDRIRLMTHATIYGTVVTALIQGTLGGIMFAIVGIPAAFLWGVVMALLSLIPSAGSFVIWIPAAIVLATQGEWWRAVLLAGWGTLVVGTIDNILYPWLVGHETRLHTLVVFLAVVGGLLVFGAAGIVLGPVAAAATVTLLDILKARGRRPAHRDAAAASG
jgi:predicted PurR-regulated permease PerM